MGRAQGDATVQCILVMGAVMCFPPLSPETVKGKKGEEALTDRVKKVLGLTLKKVDEQQQQ